MGRRRAGNGGVHFIPRSGYWIARIRLASGKAKTRACRSREEAEVAVAQLLEEFSDQLSWRYHRFGPGSRALARFAKDEATSPSRKAIRHRLRFQIMERDGFRCRYCGATAAQERLTVDHVQSVADGGTNDPTNLVTACNPCNLGKGGRTIPFEAVGPSRA